MPSLSVIIVNLNGEHLLEDCLGSLCEQTYRDFEVIFVDNGSQDGSVARARGLLPEIHIIALAENLGFAQGANLGLQKAAGRCLVLLNNDTWVAPDFLAELAKAAETDERVGMVAPKILNFFQRTRIDSVGGLLLCRDGIAQGRGRGETDTGQYDAGGRALMPSGCAALYRRELLDEVGAFDGEFFAYGEDTDLGLRAAWAGWETAAAPRAIAYHKYSATAQAYSPFKMLLVERNHYFVALKNYPLRLLLTLPLWSLYRFALMTAAVLGGQGKGGAARGKMGGRLLLAFLQAHWLALIGAPRQWSKRTRLRRIRPPAFAALLKAHRLPIAAMVFNP